MNLSVAELTWLLKWILRILAGLAVLYAATWILLRFLTRMTRRTVAQTDLDLIGQEARVIRTIRPGHNGRILYTGEGQTINLNASSSRRIDSGTMVLITAIDSGVARTIVKETPAPEMNEL